MTNEWTPKAGDRVKIIGHPSTKGVGIGSILFPGTIPDWYFVRSAEVEQPWYEVLAHVRNLDLILEDERKGLPRPPIKAGEKVQVVAETMVYIEPGTDGHQLAININATVPDVRIRQIERRVRNLGRNARKEGK